MSIENARKSKLVAICVMVTLFALPLVGCSGSKPDIADVERMLVRSLPTMGGDASKLTVESVTKTKGVDYNVFGQDIYELSYTATVRANTWASVEVLGSFRPGELKKLRAMVSFEKTDSGWKHYKDSGFHGIKTLEIRTPKELQDAATRLRDSAMVGVWGVEDYKYEFTESGDYTGREVPSDQRWAGKWAVDVEDASLILTSKSKIRGGYEQSTYFIMSYEESSRNLITRAESSGNELIWTKQESASTKTTSTVSSAVEATVDEKNAVLSGIWTGSMTFTSVKNTPKSSVKINFDSKVLELIVQNKEGTVTADKSQLITSISGEPGGGRFEMAVGEGKNVAKVNFVVKIQGNEMAGEFSGGGASGILEASRE